MRNASQNYAIQKYTGIKVSVCSSFFANRMFSIVLLKRDTLIMINFSSKMLITGMGDIEIYIYDNGHLKYHGYCKYHDIK